MSLSSKPIRFVLPLLVVILSIASLAAGAVVAVTLHSSNAARANLGLRESAKSDVDRFAFLNERVQNESQVMQMYPTTAATLGPKLQADGAEMVARMNHATSLKLNADEAKAVQALKQVNQDFTVWGKTAGTRTDSEKVLQEYNELLQRVATTTTAAQDVLQASVVRQRKVVDDASSRTGWLAGGLAAGDVALSAFLFLFARQLVRRLNVLSGAIDQVATGDLTVTTDASGRDEVAHIGTALNTMTTNLRSVVSSVSDTSARLDDSARDLEAVALRVGTTVDEASSQAELAARSASEVSLNVQTVSSGSREMGQSIAEIGRNAQEAAQVATGAVHAVEETTDKMSKLGDSSREIGDVVRLITSIAEQTNLLALNATIEAARAGDAGKGFAVVADEVKQLAQETARATEDISRRVETIQADADEAAQSISQIAGVIGRINEFQTTIASAVEQQTAATETINQSVAYAAAGSARIAENISAVAGATSQTSTTALGARDSAKQLSGMSQELRRLVDSFRH